MNDWEVPSNPLDPLSSKPEPSSYWPNYTVRRSDRQPGGRPWQRSGGGVRRPSPKWRHDRFDSKSRSRSPSPAAGTEQFRDARRMERTMDRQQQRGAPPTRQETWGLKAGGVFIDMSHGHRLNP